MRHSLAAMSRDAGGPALAPAECSPRGGRAPLVGSGNAPPVKLKRGLHQQGSSDAGTPREVGHAQSSSLATLARPQRDTIVRGTLPNACTASGVDDCGSAEPPLTTEKLRARSARCSTISRTSRLWRRASSIRRVGDMIYLAVSITNCCEYCIASHSRPRNAGISKTILGDLTMCLFDKSSVRLSVRVQRP